MFPPVPTLENRATDDPQPPLATRDRLIRTAARMFLGSGYQAVSVNAICAEIGILKGTFYHHFPSKSVLVIAVIDHLEVELSGTLERHERSARGPIAKIRAHADAVAEIQGHLEAVHGRVVGCPFGNLAMELRAGGRRRGRHVGAALGRWRDRIAGHCHDADEVGLLLPNLDPDELATRVIAAMQGMVLLAKVGEVPLAKVPVAMRSAVDSALAP